MVLLVAQDAHPPHTSGATGSCVQYFATPQIEFRLVLAPDEVGTAPEPQRKLEGWGTSGNNRANTHPPQAATNIHSEWCRGWDAVVINSAV